MADGRVVGSPQYSVEDAEAAIASRPMGLPSYASMFAAPAPTPSVAGGLTTRPVTTLSTDKYGELIFPGSNTNPILEQVKSNAVAQALAGAAPNQPNGSIVSKSGTEKLPTGPQGWDPVSGYGPMPNASPALSAIDTVAPARLASANVSLPRPRPNIANGFIQPDWTVANQGMGGITQDPRIGNNRQGRALAQQPVNNITVPGNKTQQALAQVRVSAAPAVATQQAAGLSPSQAYAAANAQAAQTAIANSSNPAANSARASLASSWGFD